MALKRLDHDVVTRLLAAGFTRRAVAAEFGVSLDAVYRCIRKSQHMAGTANKARSPWTQRDDDFLSAHWQLLTDEQLGALLKRSAEGVAHRRTQLRLVRSNANATRMNPEYRTRGEVWLANAQACVLHLADLKRAGHSPTQTESHLMRRAS